LRKKQLLFVTYQNRQSEEGLTYAIGLAKTLGKGLSILMVRDSKGLMERFSDAMAAAAFAEEGEHETAREMMRDDDHDHFRVDKRVEYLKQKCHSSGVDAEVRPTNQDAAAAIKGTLKYEDGIDMILLGPNVTENENFTAKKLGRMIRTATMPIVTIASKAGCAA